MTFEDVLNEAIGSVGSNADIRLSIARCYEYQFDAPAGPLRLWRGQGRLFTSDTRVWTGTVDALGKDHHQVPALDDGRDGTAANLQFGFPFLDKATWSDLKAMRVPVAGRLIRCWLVAVLPGEGLRPATAPEFFADVTMQAATFADATAMTDDGAMVRTYGITVLAKGGNAGRSRAPRGTYTDACQQQRAALLGVALDKGCGFVASIANETLQFP